MIELLRCHPNEIDEFWNIFEEPFAIVEKRSNGLRTAEGIRLRAKSGAWQIWIVRDDSKLLSVVGTQLIMADDGNKWAELVFCIGEVRELWQEKLSEIEEWARLEGCTRMQAIARRGWARVLPNYISTYAVIEKDLR